MEFYITTLLLITTLTLWSIPFPISESEPHFDFLSKLCNSQFQQVPNFSQHCQIPQKPIKISPKRDLYQLNIQRKEGSSRADFPLVSPLMCSCSSENFTFIHFQQQLKT